MAPFCFTSANGTIYDAASFYQFWRRLNCFCRQQMSGYGEGYERWFTYKSHCAYSSNRETLWTCLVYSFSSVFGDVFFGRVAILRKEIAGIPYIVDTSVYSIGEFFCVCCLSLLGIRFEQCGQTGVYSIMFCLHEGHRSMLFPNWMAFKQHTGNCLRLCI